MKAAERAGALIGAELVERIKQAGINLLWDSETAFLIMAANNKEQECITYKGIDQIQSGGIEEGEALKEVQIRKVEERESRKTYQCQCGQVDCQEIIYPKERYVRLKLVEKMLGERKNKERSISLRCSWYEHWKAFLK